jgi:protease-4
VTKRQKIAIGAVLAAPIVLGIVLMSVNSGPGASKFSSFSSHKVGLVQVSDVIYSSEDYVKQLRDLREDDAVAGVILRVDSPGGAVAPSQEVFEEVMKFRDIKKPLVVSMGNLAASGGYYISSPAFKIFANPGSVTGSIGAIMSFPHYYKLLNKIGVDVEVIKAGELKDVGSPHRESTPREKAYLQTMLNDIHNQFIEDVSRARSIDIDSLRPIADGRIFTGRQALLAGLVDTLGSYEDALSYLKEYLGLPDKTGVIEKKKPESFLKRMLYDELFNKFPLLKRASAISASIAPSVGPYFLFDMSVR